MKDNTNRARRQSFSAKSTNMSLPRDYPWKVLGWLRQDLEEHLESDQTELLEQIVRDRDFAAAQILADDWGLQNSINSPRSEHVSKIRARYQLSSLLKKFRFDTEKEQRLEVATEKFRAAEDVCSAFNSENYLKLSFGETEHDAQVFSYARSFLSKLLDGGSTSTHDIVTKWSRHGPGSNLDTCKGKISLYDKYGNWPYSCTKSAIPYARYLIQSDKRWLGFLEDSYRSRFKIPTHLILNQEEFWQQVLTIVEGNRITFVPKSALTERTIAIEPSINLMLQLGVDGHIRTRLKRWDVDLDSQEKNQRFAYQGSINPTSDQYSTLDLSAASDTISLKLCELLLPPDWYSYLCKIRSPLGKLGDEVISYEKISSMGNGYTFALESAIFASFCYGVIRSCEGVCDPKTDFCVFGDDIIVKQKHVSKVVRALNSAGFALNLEKSFVSGPIKESCGADWALGKPVRPVFLSDTPTDVFDLLVDVNRLERQLSLRWGIEGSITVTNMEKWIPESFRRFTGPRSDTEFDSYRHQPYPTNHRRNRNGSWKYICLSRKAVTRKGNFFLQRKMMHDLRGASIRPIKALFGSKRKKITSGGNRFTVTKSYSWTVGTTYSAADFWQSDYTDLLAGMMG